MLRTNNSIEIDETNSSDFSGSINFEDFTSNVQQKYVRAGSAENPAVKITSSSATIPEKESRVSTAKERRPKPQNSDGGHSNTQFVVDNDENYPYILRHTQLDSGKADKLHFPIPERKQALQSTWAMQTRDEVHSFQTKLNKHSIAKSLSTMYGLLIVSVSFTFVVAMLWIDDYTRLTTDIVSTILILPGLLFITFAFCSMYERNGRAGDEHRTSLVSRSASPSWRGGVDSAASSSMPSGVRRPDSLNGFLKAALVMLTIGAVAQHAMLLVDHHISPHFTDYPEMYLASIRKYELFEKQTVKSANHAQHQHFQLSSIRTRLLVETVFWHTYVGLCMSTYVLSALFLLCLPKFRFEKHRLVSCVGMVHLCVLNAYLWLYLTALETKTDLDLDAARELHKVHGAVNHSVHNNATLTNGQHSETMTNTVSPVWWTTNRRSPVGVAFIDNNIVAVPHKQLGRVFDFKLTHFERPESGSSDSSSSKNSEEDKTGSVEDDSSNSTDDSSNDISDSPGEDWKKMLIMQTGHESVPKALAEFFFPFIPELVIINVTTIIVNWMMITRNPVANDDLLSNKARTGKAVKLTLKTRREVIEVRELEGDTTKLSHRHTVWRSLKAQTLGGWLLTSTSVIILVTVLVFIFLMRYMYRLSERSSVQRIMPLLVEIGLYLCMIVSSLYAWYHLNKLPRIKKHSITGYLDRVLLATCALGMYSFATWSIIGVLYAPTLEGILNAVSAVLLIVESTIQSILIFDSRNRVLVCWDSSNTNDTPPPNDTATSDVVMIKQISKQRRRTKGRASLGFLMLVDNAFWMINVFRTLQAREHPLEMAYYGALGWTIIVHLTVPAMILFRFHAAVMLFEIWLSLNRIVVPVRTCTMDTKSTSDENNNNNKLLISSKSAFPTNNTLLQAQLQRRPISTWTTVTNSA